MRDGEVVVEAVDHVARTGDPTAHAGEHYEDGDRLMSLATFYEEYAEPVAGRALQAEQVVVEDPTAPFRA